MSLKRHSPHLSALASALLLSACGSGGGDDQAAVDTPADPPAAETPVAAAIMPENLIPPEVFAQLERTGELPILDRSDTLIGIDLNDNGIRDDVEDYIATHFSETPAQQTAALQFARAVQEQIEVDLDNPEAVQDALNRTARSIVCMASRFSGNEDITPRSAMEDIQAISSNTYFRLVSYLAFSEAADGAVISLPRTGEGCDE